ncbi:hypothetical protein MMC27_000155 [Xylographa pallens]|nr:hypothetical protein [Xylographa pallens]
MANSMNMEFNEPFENFSYLDLLDPFDPEAYGLFSADAASPATSMDTAPFDGPLLDLGFDFHANLETVDGFLQQSVPRLSGLDLIIPVSSQGLSPYIRLHQPDPKDVGNQHHH